MATFEWKGITSDPYDPNNWRIQTPKRSWWQGLWAWLKWEGAPKPEVLRESDRIARRIAEKLANAGYVDPLIEAYNAARMKEEWSGGAMPMAGDEIKANTAESKGKT